MNETTNPSAALEKEHLNKIIAVLIDQNDVLKKEIEWLKIRIGLTEQGKSDPEIGMAFEQFLKSYPETGNGLTAGLKSDAEIGVGFPLEWKSISKTGTGLTEGLKSYPEIGNGLTAQLEPLPQIINPDGFLVSALISSLTASGFRYVKKSTLRNAALLLIHFYNKGDGAYPELKKVTKLSTGGIGKFMTSIRKRGLIQRYAYKKYELTAHGMNVLQQAYSKVKNNTAA